jgi:alkylation response protein AidB-like acyl-CoA dehydrogenase
MPMQDRKKMRGGAFLVQKTTADQVYTPEERSEEDSMMKQMCEDFLEKEVFPHLDDIDHMKEGLMESLLEKSGELGLMALSIPETYGGFNKNFNTSLLVTEVIGSANSFAVAFAAHTGIGTLPILYFGNDVQKDKYLPKLATGEWKASYCLTEPGSGSDALAAKTKAVLSPDKKHYILNGQKMWITNAGFADVFVVFAQVDGDKFTGFIIEKGTEGLSLGNEEYKMGIKGSSTRQVFLNDCKVPTENVLGDIGRGHVIAFNILNIGRIKLGAAVLGAAKRAVTFSVKYANERQQFGRSISNFGAIQHKLAQQLLKTYTLESALYRAGADIEHDENYLLEKGKTHAEALLGAAKEFSVEAAILKVAGSEMLDYVVDEGVQIYGGYGFSEDFPMARAYRDSRINRIFEGTNEINRMLIVGMLLRKALGGKIDLLTPAKKVQADLMEIPDFAAEKPEGYLINEVMAVDNMKKMCLLVAGFAAQKYMQKIEREQELMMMISDMVIQTYLAESVVLRAQKQQNNTLVKAIAQVSVRDAMDIVQQAAYQSVESMSTGDEARMLNLGIKRFSKMEHLNRVELRREIATKLISENQYFM